MQCLVRPRPIVERRHWTDRPAPRSTQRWTVMMHSQSAAHGKQPGVFPVGEQHSRRSTRLAGSVRERVIESFAKSSPPIDNSIARRHAVMIFELRFANRRSPTGRDKPSESLTNDQFYGIDELA